MRDKFPLLIVEFPIVLYRLIPAASIKMSENYTNLSSTWLYYLVKSTFDLFLAKSASSAMVLKRFTELVNFLLLIHLFDRADYQWLPPNDERRIAVSLGVL